MNAQFGGLKLRDSSKTGFIPIYDMINKHSCVLTMLTYKSLKGFMISLDISQNDSEYFGLKNSRFEKPVTSFILKFAVIAPKNDEGLPVYKTVNKSSESKESYYEEAKLQQTIWTKSIAGGRPEMCPPVANFSLFDNENAKHLCNFFQSKSVGDVKEIFDYLINLINTNNAYGIGVIVMPKVERSLTFGDLIYAPKDKVSKLIKNEAYASVSAKIVRLFVEIGVIHFDLHTGNALVYFTPSGVDSLIIDFGRASNVMSPIDDDYITVTDKQKIIRDKNNFYNQLLSMSPDAPDANKKNYIFNVLNYIADIDYEKNQQMFGFSDPNRYQMDWFDRYPKEVVPVDAFNILKQSITTEGLKMSVSTIKAYESKGYILDLNRRSINSFIVEFPDKSLLPPVQQCDESTGLCVISGGKKRRKSRKNKKHKKSRKNIKSRKVQ